ncbi:MAG: FkbM family methyltransferase [Gammaproteobacteria bacterium]|nr:FkbM family methyltransferase [Gammaproteobacteria bacterium]
MNLQHRIFRFAWNQRWIDLRHKKAIYKKLCSYGDVPDAPFSADFFGLQYEGNLNNSVEFALFYMGAFEKPLLFFLRDTMQLLRQSTNGSRQSFFDIGANIGQHSLFMSLHADQVHAFEPYCVVSQKLERHIELNEIGNIQLHKVGLSNQQEELDFYAPTGRNQGIGSFDAGTVSKGNKKLGKLALVRGDDYLAQNKLQDIALLKIDVEGFEKNVVTGLRETLEKSRPVIVVEVTYGNSLSFASFDELKAALPTDYLLFRFNNRKADGSKARRRGAKAKRSGNYELIPFDEWRISGQDDVIACPKEKLGQLPRKNPP